MSECDEDYRTALQELVNKSVDHATFAKAMVAGKGVKGAVEASYIELRVQDLTAARAAREKAAELRNAKDKESRLAEFLKRHPDARNLDPMTRKHLFSIASKDLDVAETVYQAIPRSRSWGEIFCQLFSSKQPTSPRPPDAPRS